MITFYPAKQFVTPARQIESRAALDPRTSSTQRIIDLEAQGKLLEAQRLKMRTEYDLEMMQEMGFCNGIENYSRHLIRPPAGLEAVHAARFFPERFSARDR